MTVLTFFNYKFLSVDYSVYTIVINNLLECNITFYKKHFQKFGKWVPLCSTLGVGVDLGLG